MVDEEDLNIEYKDDKVGGSDGFYKFEVPGEITILMRKYMDGRCWVHTLREKKDFDWDLYYNNVFESVDEGISKVSDLLNISEDRLFVLLAIK